MNMAASLEQLASQTGLLQPIDWTVEQARAFMTVTFGRQYLKVPDADVRKFMQPAEKAAIAYRLSEMLADNLEDTLGMGGAEALRLQVQYDSFVNAAMNILKDYTTPLTAYLVAGKLAYRLLPRVGS